MSSLVHIGLTESSQVGVDLHIQLKQNVIFFDA